MGLSAQEKGATDTMFLRSGAYAAYLRSVAQVGCIMNQVGSALGAFNRVHEAGQIVSEMVEIGCMFVPRIKVAKACKAGKLKKFLGAMGGMFSSFEAGTLVRTKDGLKPIEQIQVGDEVAAWDEATNTIQYQKVTERYVREATQALKITVQAKDGKTETFTVTPEHPFLTPKSQWAAISGYEIGDQIATAIGEPVTITAIETLEGKREVFNLSVAEDHSYAVGELGVWAHNGFGAYITKLPGGKFYVGKGGLDRAKRSTREKGGAGFIHIPACSDKDSFILEDMIIEAMGGVGGEDSPLVNRRNSPGRKFRGRK